MGAHPGNTEHKHGRDLVNHICQLDDKDSQLSASARFSVEDHKCCGCYGHDSSQILARYAVGMAILFL